MKIVKVEKGTITVSIKCLKCGKEEVLSISKPVKCTDCVLAEMEKEHNEREKKKRERISVKFFGIKISSRKPWKKKHIKKLKSMIEDAGEEAKTGHWM